MPLLDTSDAAVARENLAAATGPVVVIPVYNGHDDVVQCLESFARWSPDAPLLVVDDASPDRRFVHVVEALSASVRAPVVLFRRDTNGGFVGACNSAFEIAGRSDVIVVNSDVVLTEGWYDRMVAAAASSSLVATVSTLTNHGTILSVPVRNTPLPQVMVPLSVEEVGRRVADSAVRLYPTLPTAIGHCALITRRALDLLGGFDTTFGRGYGEEVDFSQRAIRLGMKNIGADDVFVFHRGGGSFGEEDRVRQTENEKIINARYGWYEKTVFAAKYDVSSPLTVALGRASVAMRGLRIAIDGRALGQHAAGTQQVILEAAASLSVHPKVSEVQLWIAGPLPSYAADRLAGLSVQVHDVAALPSREAGPSLPAADIAYRPYQATEPEDIDLLRRLGTWVVVNQLDTIAFSNPTYFAGPQHWLRYRANTHLVFASVDGIAYLSESSRREARSEGLVDGHVQEAVVYNPAGFEPGTVASRPGPLADRPGPFLLVLGVSYHHKNRALVVRAVRTMAGRGWGGTLVLAGAMPPSGSSMGDEAAEFLADPALRNRVVQLGGVTDAEKKWLFDNSDLLLYPSVVEGFGLVPFEAAAHGLASLSSRQTSLSEVLPADIPVLEDFTVEGLADAIESLLADATKREAIVSALRDGARRFDGASTAGHLVELFDRVMMRPPRRSVAVVDDMGGVATWDERLRKLLKPAALPRTVPPGRLVKLGSRAPTVKRILSPEGSRRQEMIRASANRYRRFLRK